MIAVRHLSRTASTRAGAARPAKWLRLYPARPALTQVICLALVSWVTVSVRQLASLACPPVSTEDPELPCASVMRAMAGCMTHSDDVTLLMLRRPPAGAIIQARRQQSRGGSRAGRDSNEDA